MSYTIPNLFLEVFRLKIEKMYRPEIGGTLPQNPTGIYSGIEIVRDLDEAKMMSHLGTPVLFPITFLGSTYLKYDKSTGAVNRFKMPDLTLPPTCVASFRRPKIMSKTAINGGYGSVKEIFGFADYQITINGFFIPDPAQPQGLTTPRSQENNLILWDDLADSIGVSSEIFNSRDIHAIVIEEFNPVPQRGRPNIVPFTIRAVSDEPIEAQIT